MTNNPETILQQRDKYFGVCFTFVQSQTPVAPPTSANTKENWMEQGTDHVIFWVQMETYPIRGTRLVILIYHMYSPLSLFCRC